MRHEMSLADSSSVPAIECAGVIRQIGNTVVIDDVSLRVAQGKTYAVLGPNGAGKSSLMEMLATLYPPDRGTLRILGLDAHEQARSVRQQIGVVFQRPTLDERLTADENLRIHAAIHGLSRAKTGALIREALEWAELLSQSDRMVREFSGGMKRRLEIARALLHRPRVLLLDEPTAGLDPQSRMSLWNRISSLSRQGLAVFATTHDLSEASRSDRVGVLAKGRLVADGPPEELGLSGDAGADGNAYLRLTGSSASQRREPHGVRS